MRIVLLAPGTRGDTQPYVALGAALVRQGAGACVAASEHFASLVEQHRLEFAPLRGDISAIATGRLADRARRADNPLKFLSSLRSRELSVLLKRLFNDLHDACRGADAVVYHPGAVIGYFAAREMGVPAILATPFPMTPTAERPSILFYPGPRLGRAYNRLTHLAFERGLWMITRGVLADYWRERFGRLPDDFGCPFRRQLSPSAPTITSCSPLVFPKPPDWPRDSRYSGYWFLDPTTTQPLSEDLSGWITADDAPVYIGFGSIGDPQRAGAVTELAIEALRLAGKRGILATAWGGLKRVSVDPGRYRFIDEAPHDRLFPLVSTVVHHGGAGTTASAFRAGVPAVVVPFANDQFAWGLRTYELGVGSQPIPRKRLTAEKLAAAIAFCDRREIRDAATSLGAGIRSERGAEESARVILDTIALDRGNASAAGIG